MGNVWRDLRLAVRLLLRNRGFAVVAVITLGLGMAANATVFGWIDTVLLRPIPGAAHAADLVVPEGIGIDGGRLSSFPHPDFRDLQREMTLAAGVTASHFGFFTVGPLDRPRRVIGQVVAANFFNVLGVKPYLGRLLQPGEDLDTQGACPYAVISYRLWRDYFHANPAVVGRPVRINGHQYTLAGVAQPEFSGSITGASLDVWVPLSEILKTGTLNTWAAADRNARFLDLIARLKPGVTVPQAAQEVRAIAARIAAAYPDTHRGVGARLIPLSDASLGLQSPLRKPLRILMMVCFLVLLIACANVANLLMARTVSRQKEFGIRVALGASRWQLVRQLLMEMMLLSLAGAVAGVLMAQWMGEALFRAFPPLDMPLRAAIEPLLSPRPSLPVLLFTALIAIGAALLSAIVPALHAGRTDARGSLGEGGRGGSSGRRSHRARGLLVVTEVALAALALVVAGLSVRGFQRLTAVDLGFNSSNVLVARLYLSTNGYSRAQELQFSRDLRLRLEASPEIRQVTYTDSIPLSMYGTASDRVQSLGPEEEGRGVTILTRSLVAPGYFNLMGIPLIEGRDFTELDDGRAERSLIVNRAFAERYYKGQSVLGRKLRVSGRWTTIVGVAKDTKYHSPAEGPTPFIYCAFKQAFGSGHNNFFLIRANDLNAARAALQREAAALNANRGFYETSTLDTYTQAGLFGQRIAASLLSALGLLALALAAAGLYSVMAYAVTERTHEIGIRMALGAQPGRVLGMVIHQGLTMAGVGLAVGVTAAAVAAPALSRALEAPVDAEPWVFAAAAAGLVVIAILASYIPARRATRVDPMTSLHTD